MSNHLFMGAINKETNNYEPPIVANKKNKYKCPSCDRDVIFKNGKIKRPHYAHKKSVEPCFYYDNPGETQIHKDAKRLMKTLLDNKNPICFYRVCDRCNHKDCIINFDENNYNECSKAVMEYGFNYNNSKKRADVALIENNNIKYIFEICCTSKTKEENRPEPWFEIKAEELINNINSPSDEIEIQCIREYKCYSCKNIEEINKNIYFNKMKMLKKKEIEQKMEKNEIFCMGNEDERTIQNKLKKRKIDIKKEEERILKIKRWREEREKIILKFKKENEENEKIILKIKKENEENEERIKKEKKEYYNKILEKNKKCLICNINYCKCDKPILVKNEYNITICRNTNCNKSKCKCVRITDFFQNK